MARSRIAVVLVSWKDETESLEAIASLASARDLASPEDLSIRLFAVDNGGSLDPRRVSEAWPSACLLANERNVGFAAAANQAACAADAEVLFFVNPDARAEGDLFSALLRAFDDHPEAVAVAPRLLDFDDSQSKIQNPKSKISRRSLASPDQEDQFTFQLRRLPGLASDARELLGLDHLLPDNPGRRRFRYADLDREKSFEVEQPAAAALAVRASAFRRVGGFDERFSPAWFEDVDLCARLLDQGRILYWPQARLRHRGGAASGALGYARFLPIYYRNALLYRRKHYGPAARVLYRLLLTAGMLLRLIALPLRRRLPRPRSECARAYLRALAVALGLSNSQFTTRNSQFPHG